MNFLSILLLLRLCLPIAPISQENIFANNSSQTRWNINKDGSITWLVKEGDIHRDHIEMSGLMVSTVVRYGVNEKGEFELERGMVWPMLRTIPNDTHASLMRKLGWNPLESIRISKRRATEKVSSITLDGTMVVQSLLSSGRGDLKMTRTLFPSTQYPAFLEKFTLTNNGESSIEVEIDQVRDIISTPKDKGVKGSYRIVQILNGPEITMLKPNESISFYASTAAFAPDETELLFDVEAELSARHSLICDFWDNLVLETPDPVINTMFAFAKIRASESIYKTACGLLHGPGGESYYAAIWANDQAEYVNPFFPYLGYPNGNISALTSYLQFARFINDDFKPIPSSIIAEGSDIWDGAGDRGDGAMIAYGASRYALSRGDKNEAEQLWPLVEWCLEYCRRQLNDNGVVASDSDELEGRFPSGDANLCTSSLYYDALNSAVYLGKALGKPRKQISAYAKQATRLKVNIEKYFGANVEGFDTYQYYKGNDILRSWICIPLTVNIFDRKDETINALFSPRLWTSEGLLTEAGSDTFWDRSTLYALRGVFACGETEKAIEYLEYYSGHRLLGDHVPYPIEAWPEGNQRHLSAESGLYCRIITEGMFGIRPTGMDSFICTPRLPKRWNTMKLRNIKAFDAAFDITITRTDNNQLSFIVSTVDKIILKQIIKEGDSVKVQLPK